MKRIGVAVHLKKKERRIEIMRQRINLDRNTGIETGISTLHEHINLSQTLKIISVTLQIQIKFVCDTKVQKYKLH